MYRMSVVIITGAHMYMLITGALRLQRAREQGSIRHKRWLVSYKPIALFAGIAICELEEPAVNVAALQKMWVCQ